MTIPIERFLKDVASHVMEVIKDDGLHRHIRFRRPNTMAMHFDLITWPGYLCYTGDMGTYVFRRLADMFEFFRPDKGSRLDPMKYIDHRYWAEKLEASDKHDGTQEFDPEIFQREISEQRRRIMRAEGRSWTKDERREAWEELDEVMSLAYEGEIPAFAAVQEWSFQPRYYRPGCQSERASLDTSDFPRCKRYTDRFLWCCYALRWGINKYDEAKPC